jgi:protein-S-isoprenylcysteine O-methyltransferase Ste14
VIIWSVLSTISTTGIFLCYAVALFCYFSSDSKISWRLKTISILSTLNLIIFIFFVFTRATDTLVAVLGIGIQMLSAALFAWAIKTTYRRRLSIAYNPDIPEFILQSGPFRLVRHPFYTSYLLFWLSLIVMQPSIVSASVTSVLFGFYLNAAKFEEAKFARSALASAYKGYEARTGMFVPRMSVPIIK